MDIKDRGSYTYVMKKTQRGRPRTDDPLIQRTIRTTDDQWESWSRAAGKRTVSTWIRDACEKKLKARSRSRKKGKGHAS